MCMRVRSEPHTNPEVRLGVFIILGKIVDTGLNCLNSKTQVGAPRPTGTCSILRMRYIFSLGMQQQVGCISCWSLDLCWQVTAGCVDPRVR